MPREKISYFAYGSNMAPNRLRQRVSSARFIGAFTLARHDLRFHKIGKDGSAKCDAFFTGAHGDLVAGVVFDLDPAGVAILDGIEGLGVGYDKKVVEVSDAAGCRLEAFTYCATAIDETLLPFSWYQHHVLVGARSAGLTSEYTARIARVRTVKDPDREREWRELAVHR